VVFQKVKAPAQFSEIVAGYGGLVDALQAGAFVDWSADAIVLQIFCKGKLYSFNLSGALVWVLIEEAASVTDVATQMCAFYSAVSLEEMEFCVESVVENMVNDGLLIPVEST
jgi:hypothetical protein